MRAITVQPGVAHSVRLETVDSPPESDGTILARTLALGICGTDVEIVSGAYGAPPPGKPRLVLGHESLLEVLDAPDGSGFVRGERIVGIVRRPDPVPCPCCAAGEWDMCRNGGYTERGIKQRDGYGAERVRLEPDFAVRVDPLLGASAVLLEPASVVAKAWEQVERIGTRAAAFAPQTVLVTGAGPIGLLAALMGRQRGYDVHVLDRVTSGPKPRLVADLGATWHAPGAASLGDLAPDVVIECTGASSVMLDALNRTAANGIVCLAGVSSGGRRVDLDLGLLNRTMVLENDCVFGTVNANRRHYEAAAQALARADPEWLARLISRRVPLAQWREAFERRPDDIKVVVDFTA